MTAFPETPKRFNVAGPCVAAKHYRLPPLERLPEVRQLVNEGDYFVIHAARQSGKTTFLRALVDAINAEGRLYALYCSLESLERVEDDEKAMAGVIDNILLACKESRVAALNGLRPEVEQRTPATILQAALKNLCRSLDKPLVLLFDEADCLSGQPIITFLRQIRTGFVERSSSPFPWSMALAGMRNLRDYKAQVRPDGDSLGTASPFNIITEAMTLPNFTLEEIGRLYQQHTEAVGQRFDPAAVERVAYWTGGQPWLVNAVARQAIENDLKRDYAKTVVAAHIDAAADILGKRRETHIESLLSRLREPRIKKIIEPVLTGDMGEVELLDDDTQYCLDLGLVVPERIHRSGLPEGLKPANPIYHEVMIRMLNYTFQTRLPSELDGRWMDGKRMDMTGLLKAFQEFWRKNSEAGLERCEYKEAWPHLVLQAFLQRVVNGGAHIGRESALGRGRADLCVEYAGRHYPIELKTAKPGARAGGVAQTARYMDRCGAREGWLVIFDRDPAKPWEEKITWTTEELPGNKVVHVAGC